MKIACCVLPRSAEEECLTLPLVPVSFCLNSDELWAGFCEGNIYLVKSRKPIGFVHVFEMLITRASEKLK